jgi:hypothetical protein
VLRLLLLWIGALSHGSLASNAGLQSPFTKAGVAGGIGCAVMWCVLYVLYPLYSADYLPKGWGTLICLITLQFPTPTSNGEKVDDVVSPARLTRLRAEPLPRQPGDRRVMHAHGLAHPTSGAEPSSFTKSKIMSWRWVR